MPTYHSNARPMTPERLIQVLTGVHRTADRVQAAEILGSLCPEEAYSALTRILTRTRSIALRSAVAFAIGEYGRQESLVPLIAMLKSSRTRGNRVPLLVALRGIDYSSVLGVLVDTCVHEPLDAKIAALESIANIDWKKVPDAVREAMLARIEMELSKERDLDAKSVLSVIKDTIAFKWKHRAIKELRNLILSAPAR